MRLGGREGRGKEGFSWAFKSDLSGVLSEDGWFGCHGDGGGGGFPRVQVESQASCGCNEHSFIKPL